MAAGNFGSPMQLLILLAIVLLLFGGKRLRNLGGDLGGAIKGFKNSMGTIDDGRTSGGDRTSGGGRASDADRNSEREPAMPEKIQQDSITFPVHETIQTSVKQNS